MVSNIPAHGELLDGFQVPADSSLMFVPESFMVSRFIARMVRQKLLADECSRACEADKADTTIFA